MPCGSGIAYTDLARTLRYGNVNGSQSMGIPGIEDDILEHRRIVILLRAASPAFAVRFGYILLQALVE
jgi:hypothetical protein